MDRHVLDAPDSWAADPTDEVAHALLDATLHGPAQLTHLGAHELPQQRELAEILEILRALLFPGFIGDPLVGATPDELRTHVRARTADAGLRVRRQIYLGLHHRCQLDAPDDDGVCATCLARAEEVATRFLRALPEIRALLGEDVRAAVEGDPAATGSDEVILCYPGLYAITAYRIAHRLLREGAAIVPRILTEHAHQRTGIDLHPGAAIGRGFFIDHGTGVVIGETTVIGERVRIYQGVTLGALSVPRGRRDGKRRHPLIEDEVVIYANATILGGGTVIGKGAVIGGNCWVTHSVPPGARISSPQAP